MESLSFVIVMLSVGVYSWAVLGLIKPVSAGLPNRWVTVPIWVAEKLAPDGLPITPASTAM